MWAALLLSLATGLVLLVVSCSGLIQPSGPTNTPAPTATPMPTPTPTPLPDPRAIMARAAESLASEQNLGFILEHPVGNTPLATGLVLSRAEGTATLPDRFQLGLDLDVSGTVLKLDVIVVEDSAYMTNLFSGAWEPVAKEQIPFRFDFVTESVAALLVEMEDTTLVGEGTLDEVTAYHIRGIGPTAALWQLIPGTLPDAELPVDLWVHKADYRLRKVQLTGPLVVNDLPDTVRVVHLEVLDEAPEITEPEVVPAVQ